MMTLDVRAIHTCWDTLDWDGQMQDGCAGCDLAAEFPCPWCGYGAIFTTHSPLAHAENGDEGMLPEDEWTDDISNLPYRDWTEFNRRQEALAEGTP